MQIVAHGKNFVSHLEARVTYAARFYRFWQCETDGAQLIQDIVSHYSIPRYSLTLYDLANFAQMMNSSLVEALDWLLGLGDSRLPRGYTLAHDAAIAISGQGVYLLRGQLVIALRFG